MKKNLKKLMIFCIRLYQAISPALLRQLPFFAYPQCKFQPTCSNYSAEAIDRYGILKGGAKSAVRILKCNPLSRGGIDYV